MTETPIIDRIEAAIIYGPEFIIRWFFMICGFIIMLMPMIIWGLIVGIKFLIKLAYYNFFEIEHTIGDVKFPRRK